MVEEELNQRNSGEARRTSGRRARRERRGKAIIVTVHRKGLCHAGSKRLLDITKRPWHEFSPILGVITHMDEYGSAWLWPSSHSFAFLSIAVDLLTNLPVKKVITPDSEEGAINLLIIY